MAMQQIQITLLDWIILFAYFIFIAGVGIYVARTVRNTDHYFLGSRGFGKWLMMGQSFSIGTHAEMPVSLAGAVYRIGFSGIWFQWKNLFITPFYWIMAPFFRRYRRTTMAEVFEDRYGVWMGAIYSLFAVIFFTINMGSMLKGAGKVISQATGGHVSVNDLVIGMTVVFILYSFMGGLVSSAWTDFFQGFLIITLSFMLIPLGWGLVGGMSGMKAGMPAYKFSLAAPEGISVWFILMLTVNGLIGIMAQPHQLAAVGTGKDEHACRVGMAAGNFIKRFCTIGWALVGLLVAGMIARNAIPGATLKDPEDAFGFACHYLLFPGALGLLIACVLAATMAACSAFMVDSGALFTQGLYRRYLAGRRDDRHYLWVGRFSGFGLTMFGVLYTIFLIDKVLYSFLLTETMATFMGISLTAGLVWKRANRWGAVSSIVVAFVVNFALYARSGQRLDHWDPNVFLFALLAGYAALVIGSLLTPPEPAERIRDMFARFDVSTDHSAAFLEASRAQGKSHELEGLPESEIEILRRKTAESGQQLLLSDLGRFWSPKRYVPLLKAYRQDLVGLVYCWGVVALLVGIAWGILQL
jgi:Na+/proline symporter